MPRYSFKIDQCPPEEGYGWCFVTSRTIGRSRAMRSLPRLQKMHGLFRKSLKMPSLLASYGAKIWLQKGAARAQPEIELEADQLKIQFWGVVACA